MHVGALLKALMVLENEFRREWAIKKNQRKKPSTKRSDAF